ncbi:hypothetical protein PROFUN_07546 [Planoprotostelium fungivorum]|uniref:Uncharacterized protein n=1 Tax=Planoprotostelium fungivorum TaxID=1890364 RepID=A0A2P6NLT4_9EUKA|nr:hypothetical protein PROFUN_07546 [Planoprotostelium fungivorum]
MFVLEGAFKVLCTRYSVWDGKSSRQTTMGDANTVMGDRTGIHCVVAFVSHCRIGVNGLQMSPPNNRVATCEFTSLVTWNDFPPLMNKVSFYVVPCHLSGIRWLDMTVVPFSSPAEEMAHMNIQPQSEKMTAKPCVDRESNPGLPRGRRKFYHWTIDACCSPFPHCVQYPYDYVGFTLPSNGNHNTYVSTCVPRI